LNVLITDEILEDAIAEISMEPTRRFGFDTETYGVHHDSKLFAIQISTATTTYYFNYHDYMDGTPILDRKSIVKLQPLFEDVRNLWYISNAKFDLRRISIEGIAITGSIHCTVMCERFINNQYLQHGLAAALKRRGHAKDDAVEKYIKEHKLWAWRQEIGKKTRTKDKFYWKVPFNIMFKYGCIDAREVRFLGEDQRKELKGESYYENDLKLEKVCFGLEETGIKVRQNYAHGGMEYEQGKQEECSRELELLSGVPYRSGPNWLSAAFDRYDVAYQRNPKTNNPVFDKTALAKIEHPIAKQIIQYRRHEKYSGTYYATYAYNEVIHAQIKMHGTDTGRFSYAEPNLQNVPKEEKLDLSVPYQVRGCFEPREDFVFVMVDFDQQEFRLLLDYAGEHDLIKRINDDGEDVHQATADMVGVSRTEAKTLNFGLLYGMGEGKLAVALGLPTYTERHKKTGELITKSREARAIKDQYFARLPNVQRLIREIINTAEKRKYIKTWVGRKLHFPRKEMCYKAPNHLIQGGCGDIARHAMVSLQHNVLDGLKSRMLIQVHDEILFEVHKSELGIVDALVYEMENTYIPYNNMRMTCGVEHSWVSWGKRDVVDGKPVPKNS